MKKLKTFISLLLVMTTLLTLLVGCKKDDETETDKESGPIQIGDISEYILVRADFSSETVTSEMMRLRATFKEKLGVTLDMTTDYVDASTPEAEKEILVGKTDRVQYETASEGLKSNDFRIIMVDEKIIIAADSDKAIIRAVDYFIANVMNTESKSLSLPVEGYSEFSDYRFDKITVDGNDLGQFLICSDDEDIASKINDAIMYDVLGVSLKTVRTTANTAGSKCIILKDSNLVENQYGVSIENGNIVVHGSYTTFEAAVEFFVNEYLGVKDAKVLNLTESSSVTCSADKKDIYTKEQLVTLLTNVNNDKNHVIVGEEVYTGQPISNVISLFQKATGGETPGVIGIDLRGLTTNESELSQWVCEITEYCSNGGILTLSHHFTNPSGNTSTVLSTGKTNTAIYGGVLGYTHTAAGYKKAFKDLVTDGTELNLKFREELDRDAEFIAALKDNGVTVMWRPFQEMNTRSFWWCAQQQNGTQVDIDPECIRNMWIYVYNYFTEVKGLDNLLWVYASANWNTELAKQCYPGDAYVDIRGVDWYTEVQDDLVSKNVFSSLNTLAPDKLGAIPEFGPGGENTAEKADEAGTKYTGEDALKDLMRLKQTHGYKFAYVMNWSVPWNLDRMGGGEAYMASEFTLGQAEVKAMFDALK